MHRRPLRPIGVALGLFATLALAVTSCSENGTTKPAPVALSVNGGPLAAEVELPKLVITEVMPNPAAANDVGEYIEVFNAGTTAVDMNGMVLRSVTAAGNPESRIIDVPVVVNPGACVILANTQTIAGVTVAFSYGGSLPLGNNAVDKVFITMGGVGGATIDLVEYGGFSVGTSVNGFSLYLDVPSTVDITTIDNSSLNVRPPWKIATSTDVAFGLNGAERGTPGVCNYGGFTPPPEIDHVTVSPLEATVFQSQTVQFTATAFEANDHPIQNVTFTWSSSDELKATVNASGFATTVGIGDVTITATAANGAHGEATLHINAPPPLPEVYFSEVHYDNTGTDIGEAIEINGPGGTDLTGWSVVLYNGNGGLAYDTRVLGETIPTRCDGRGIIVLDYPTNGVQNGAPDGLALVDAEGHVVEFLSYEGNFTATDGPAAGLPSQNMGVLAVEEPPSPVGQSLQRNDVGLWQAPAANSFGRCNSEGQSPPVNGISFSGRLTTDPPLPVGFEAQIFATERDGATGANVTTTFTWVPETPDIASIDTRGVIRSLAAGTATFRATATDGVTGTYSLQMAVGVASTTAQYADNTEFGDPFDADPSDDFIIRHLQFTTSFSSTRNTPNWVSYDLEATHFGSSVDRCNCFTHDPSLPSEFTHLNTADYTGAGSAAGYGIDRGHMTRSFDRTSATLDNAFTYYLSNVIPQAADLNQGPWARMENDLGDLARNQNKEVYIITGPAGNKGTVKSEGKIVIPTSVWKVAVIMPRDKGLADVHTAQDIEQVIAVIMPNDPGVRNVDWHTYETTVDAVELLSGYNVLDLLPDQIEIALESNTKPPVAGHDGPYTSNEGQSVTMSAASSTDPDGDALTYSWKFGDGQTGAGASVSHTYAQNGAYTIELTVTDIRGLYAVTTTTAQVANVTPIIAAFNGTSLFPGETYSAAGSFTDPGADPWSATVNYGDGSGVGSLALAGKNFSLLHTYETAGTFTVTVRVTDDLTFGERSQTVTVLTAEQGIQNVIALLDQLEPKSGKSDFKKLRSRLEKALKQMGKDKDHTKQAVKDLEKFLEELDETVESRGLTAAQAEPMRVTITRAIRSLTR